MAEQIFLLKINKQYRASAVKKLCDRIRQLNGRVLLLTDAGYLMIVHIDEAFRNILQSMPEVALLGGVHIYPKPIRHIRVNQSGHLIASHHITVQSNSNQQGG